MSNPGKYRFSVVIERKVEGAQSGTGAIGPPTWAKVAYAYASIEPLTGSIRAAEIIAAAQEKNKSDTLICIRGQLSGVDATMRVRHPLTGNVYDIRDIVPDYTLVWETKLYCESGLNAG